MAGESDLDLLLQQMAPVVRPGTFVYCNFPDAGLPDGLTPICTMLEAEGLTAILPREQAQAQGIPYQFESALITLSVHSSLTAVGFLARICSALAATSIPCNVVSGYYHDHLLVPRDRLPDTLTALGQLSRGEAPTR